ncbi:crcb protein, putative [Heliomicrobium modesticaldum Ice1]|uniref:Fluoride-specific ion channel FluC n=1 Tax=Heliobacterium modesticaldum (strain ATCC 51547 / Ice1) TaxID=498761 RepID=B0TB34_HELMI|nr:fluoride efflux transporter CrcB [Heliomicrobium modesticaldum]ABZ83761.1 crcb protein, putative [Heliomicrobium modesticaldum Ice1]
MSYLAVALGGFVGALLRFEIGHFFSSFVQQSGFPWGTLIINLTGCFTLSLFLTLTLDFVSINPNLRLGVSTGFLGAYTTFSTFALESIQLLQQGQYWSFGIYIFSSVLLGIAMSAFGLFTARAIAEYRRNKFGEEEELSENATGR